MKYMGSKRRIAKHILPIMLAEAEKRGITRWVEPFVGGGNMIDKVPHTFIREGYDINDHVIHALVDIRDKAHQLPDQISEEYYKSQKGMPAATISSYSRFVASFGGRFENGYARESGGDESTFAGYGKRNALKQSPLLRGTKFNCASFQALDFFDCLIYCDPPYQGTTSYKTDSFPHDVLFDWCRTQAKKNVVFVSEYSAPDDFVEVWRGEQKTNFASSRKSATHTAIEKLYRVY